MQVLICGLLQHSLCAPSAFQHLVIQFPVTNALGLKCQVWCVFLILCQPNWWKLIPCLNMNFSDYWDKLVLYVYWPPASVLWAVYFLYPSLPEFLRVVSLPELPEFTRISPELFIYFLLIYKNFCINPFCFILSTFPSLSFVFSLSSWYLWSIRTSLSIFFFSFSFNDSSFHIILRKSLQLKIIKINSFIFPALMHFLYVYNLNTFETFYAI